MNHMTPHDITMPQCMMVISVSLSRYSSLSEAHRQAFGSEEDTLLSLVLHNLLVYMLMVGLSKEETTDLIHRLMARTRLATAEERLLQQTLKHVEQNVREGVWRAGGWGGWMFLFLSGWLWREGGREGEREVGREVGREGWEWVGGGERGRDLSRCIFTHFDRRRQLICFLHV